MVKNHTKSKKIKLMGSILIFYSKKMSVAQNLFF